MAKLTAKFFERHPKEVAKDLLGRVLVRKIGNKRYVGIISEVGAYAGTPNKKSTNYNGMLYEPGIIHIFKYRGNCSLNISTEKRKKPSVVHISKLIPIYRIEELVKGKNISKEHAYRLTNGPGKLTNAFKIDEAYDGKSIKTKDLWIEGKGIIKSNVKKVDKNGLAEICLGYYSLS